MNCFIKIIIFWSTISGTAITTNGLSMRFEDLVQKYDSAVIPDNIEGLQINVTLLISSLEMDEKNQKMKILGELQQEWNDHRLRHSNTANLLQTETILSGRHGDRIKEHIWLPDLTVAEGTQTKGEYEMDILRIRSDGHMLWKQQIAYQFPCRFELSYYPLSNQICKIKFHSLGHSNREINPRWASEQAVNFLDARLSLRYEIEDVELLETNVATLHEMKKQLEVDIELYTYTGWPVKHTVLPLIAAVLTSYLCFFISPDCVTARMVLSCSSLLFGFLIHLDTYAEFPEYAYTTALEVFSGTCLAFVWFAVAQSVVVNIVVNLGSKETLVNNHNTLTNEIPSPVHDKKPAIWLDMCFRVLYPSIFLAFNVVFWILYH